MAPDPARFAALLCEYCLDVEPGQQVVVRSSTLAAPLLLALQEELLVREAWPLIRAELPGADETFAQQAGMGTTVFAAFVRRALFLDRGEATAAWSELRHFQDRLIGRLKDATEL